MKKIDAPYRGEKLDLSAGDLIELNGTIYCGRDAVLPHIVKMAEEGGLKEEGIDLEGAVIFHTAVSCAGIAPTTTSKPEIEGSILPLSRKGVRFHLGKGLISPQTIKGLAENHAFFLITPPVAALLTACMYSCRALVHPEYGMEAFYEIKVRNFPAIVAVANGETIFSKS